MATAGGGGNLMREMMKSRGAPPDLGKMAAAGMGGVRPGSGSGGRPEGIQLDAKGKPRLTRTEFVILFVWKEPTPSDLLLPEETGAGNIPQAR
jgi:hypothetical protein